MTTEEATWLQEWVLKIVEDPKAYMEAYMGNMAPEAKRHFLNQFAREELHRQQAKSAEERDSWMAKYKMGSIQGIAQFLYDINRTNVDEIAAAIGDLEARMNMLEGIAQATHNALLNHLNSHQPQGQVIVELRNELPH